MIGTEPFSSKDIPLQYRLGLITLPETLSLFTRKLELRDTRRLHLDIVAWHGRRDNVPILHCRWVDVVLMQGIDVFEERLLAGDDNVVDGGNVSSE